MQGKFTFYYSLYFQFITVCIQIPSSVETGENTPIPKKDICLVDNDLKPVTLTSVLPKCLEKLVRRKLLNYVSDQLDQCQFAYLSGRPTDDAICSLIHNIFETSG